MTEERAPRYRTAILAADVAGYSRLIEQDEAGTLAALADDLDHLCDGMRPAGLPLMTVIRRLAEIACATMSPSTNASTAARSLAGTLSSADDLASQTECGREVQIEWPFRFGHVPE